jgi:DNA-binding LytR/AlgR family response regulator
MNILLADDEKPAREELRFILTDLLPYAHFYEAIDGSEALRMIEKAPIDVVFLDIHMPGFSGLEVAEALLDMPNPPTLIFATAYNEHALRAFELAALDYVVKPFDENRLAKTVERLHKSSSTERETQQRHALQTFVANAAANGQIAKMWAERDNGNRVLVDYKEILLFEADEKYVYLLTTSGEKLLVRRTLKELQERLGPYNLVRVHKAFIVNLDHVAEIEPWFVGGSYLVRMKYGERKDIVMSRRYAAQIKDLLDW